jgi:hypothetical protein
MKTFPTLILIALLTAGCASAPTATPAAPANAVATQGPVARTPAGLMTGRDASSTSRPLSVTANPPHILAGATLAAPAGWQTFTSPTLGLAVDFPADWTAAEGTAGVTFRSPQGATVSLAAENAAPQDSAAQCTALVLASGLKAQTCGDPATNRYQASFQWTGADGAGHAAVLSTQDAAALEVYKSMLASMRPAQ